MYQKLLLTILSITCQLPYDPKVVVYENTRIVKWVERFMVNLIRTMRILSYADALAI